MTKQSNMSHSSIARLNLACQFRALAKRQTSSQVAAVYYRKAYAILRQEMGSSAITSELQKEMTR
ncbi:MAG: hypothetical protein J6Q22_01325 [Prevotella sp.]|nr:hypothetical protein [Prevotella sp.]